MSRTIVKPLASICIPFDAAWIARSVADAAVLDENDLIGADRSGLRINETAGADGGDLGRRRRRDEREQHKAERGNQRLRREAHRPDPPSRNVRSGLADGTRARASCVGPRQLYLLRETLSRMPSAAREGPPDEPPRERPLPLLLLLL